MTRLGLKGIGDKIILKVSQISGAILSKNCGGYLMNNFRKKLAPFVPSFGHIFDLSPEDGHFKNISIICSPFDPSKTN